MLSKRTHPMIGKISELLVGVNRSAAAPFFDVLMTSPKSPLDFKFLPQVSQRNSSKRFYDDNLGGSVGLGIVAALENSNTRRIMSVCRSELNQENRSDPVQFMSQEGSADEEEDEEMFVMDDDDDEEDYTLVTCHHGPNGSCSTKVYDRDGFECFSNKVKEDHRKRLFMVGVGMESPVNSPEFKGSDFLSSCNLCRKKLHGQDIFIYKGEKSFCSTECRSSFIANDEKKKRSKLKSSASPYTAGQIFSAGVQVMA